MAGMLRLLLSLGALGLVAALLAVVFVSSADPGAVARADRLAAEAEHLERLVAEKEAENTRLFREIEALRNDDRYLGIIARQQLGMLGPNEIVLHFR
jgi:cell division protein FtsB